MNEMGPSLDPTAAPTISFTVIMCPLARLMSSSALVQCRFCFLVLYFTTFFMCCKI